MPLPIEPLCHPRAMPLSSMFTNGLFDFINTRASIAQRSIKKPEQ
jgi:hypothetical protein